MNKVFIVLLGTALMSTAAGAQKISADKIPAPLVSAFQGRFPGATKISWEIENGNEYEADFKLHGEEVSASFDNTGKLLETETEMMFMKDEKGQVTDVVLRVGSCQDSKAKKIE